MQPRQPTSRRAFTLIETVIALAVTVIILSGLSAAMVVAAHAVPAADEPGAQDRLVIDTMNEFRAHMRLAETVNFTVRAAGIEIALTLKDTGVLGSPASVRYRFFNDSDQITRSIDAEPFEQLITNVSGFDGSLSYEGTTLHALALRFTAPDTIQGAYEFTVSLPNAPEIV